MSELVFVEGDEVFTDSFTVAKMFEKTHDNVIRDIRNQLEKLDQAGESEWAKLNFEECEYTGASGAGINQYRKYKKYNLTEDGFALVAMSYTTPEAMKMKVKFLDEFRRMKRELSEPKIPQNYSEALRLAADLEEEKQELQTEVKEMKPKATYYDLVLQNSSLLSVSQISKDYGMSANKLNKKLHELGVQYKRGGTWFLYQRYADKGYAQTKTHLIDADKGNIHLYWTQRGRLFIYHLLKEQGILPIMERESTQQLQLV